jgi:hypothetical protein
MTTDSTLSPGFAREAGGAGRWGPLLSALLVGVLLGIAARDVASGAMHTAAAAFEPPAAVREWPERELPREWRWQGRAYDFDRMFRRPRPAPGAQRTGA